MLRAMDQGPGFVHLHVHSSFSLREGALSIAKLGKLAAADGMPALAITDTNNLFGALEFSEKLAKEGIQPIVGIQLTVDFGDGALFGRDGARQARGSIVLLAATEDGYTHLMRLGSEAYLDPTPGDAPHIAFDRLVGSTAGVLVLTGGPNGAIDRVLGLDRPDAAAARLDRLVNLFGKDAVYVELQRHGLPEERRLEGQLLELAYGRELRLVATNEPFFAGPADHEAHDALICIAEGRMLAESVTPGDLEENIFEIVNHLNLGAPLIESQAERDSTAELDQIAAQRAKASTAHVAAHAYAASGRALFGADAWQRNFRLTFELELQLADCEFVLADLQRAEARLYELGSRATSLTERAAVISVQMNLYTAMNFQADHAVEICLEYLRFKRSAES